MELKSVLHTNRLAGGHRTDILQRVLGVFGRVKGESRFVFRIASPVGKLGFFFLKVAGIRQKNTEQIGRRL